MLSSLKFLCCWNATSILLSEAETRYYFFPFLLKEDWQMKFVYNYDVQYDLVSYAILWDEIYKNWEMINKIKLINVSIAPCSYLVTESVSVSLYVCVCVCVFVENT